MIRQALISQFVVNWSSSSANLIFSLLLASVEVLNESEPSAVATMAVNGTCGSE